MRMAEHWQPHLLAIELLLSRGQLAFASLELVHSRGRSCWDVGRKVSVLWCWVVEGVVAERVLVQRVCGREGILCQRAWRLRAVSAGSVQAGGNALMTVVQGSRKQ